MEQEKFADLEKSLNEIDLGISEHDGAAGRFAKKLVNGIFKKCLKDRSGAAFYKIAHSLMNIVPGEGHNDLLDLIENGAYCNNAKTLNQVYTCLGSILSNHPETSEQVITCIIKRSNQNENDESCIKQVFALCEKASLLKPEYTSDLLKVKRNALSNLATNSPEKCMKVMSALLAETYPSKEDLAIYYHAFQTMLKMPNMKKEAYPPMLQLLAECAKSGHNEGENRRQLSDLCTEIELRNPNYKAEIIIIKQNMARARIENAGETKLTETAKSSKKSEILATRRDTKQYS